MMAKHGLAQALRTVRTARGLSQEAFGDVSSRTYLSSLERGLKNPTLNKLSELCEVMQIHPLTLMTMAYAGTASEAESLLAQVNKELQSIRAKVSQPRG
ncbi:Transcriptional regulator, PbsX family [plant metagenome]